MNALIYMAFGAALALALTWARTRFSGFLAQKPEDYVSDRGLDFDVRKHLNGPLKCEGMIYGPTGRVSSRFVARFDCSWNGAMGVMSERFQYDDGSFQDREWALEVDANGRIKARASDVIGVGFGVAKGAALQLKYRFQLPADAGGHVLDTVDWMYLTPNGHIMNRSQFRKFGIKVAELVATIRPMTAEELALEDGTPADHPREVA